MELLFWNLFSPRLLSAAVLGKAFFSIKCYNLVAFVFYSPFFQTSYIFIRLMFENLWFLLPWCLIRKGMIEGYVKEHLDLFLLLRCLCEYHFNCFIDFDNIHVMRLGFYTSPYCVISVLQIFVFLSFSFANVHTCIFISLCFMSMRRLRRCGMIDNATTLHKRLNEQNLTASNYGTVFNNE